MALLFQGKAYVIFQHLPTLTANINIRNSADLIKFLDKESDDKKQIQQCSLGTWPLEVKEECDKAYRALIPYSKYSLIGPEQQLLIQYEPLIYIKNDEKLLKMIQKEIFDKILNPSIGDRLEDLIEQLKIHSKNKIQSYLIIIPELIGSDKEDITNWLKEEYSGIFAFFENVKENPECLDWNSMADSEPLVLMFIHEFLNQSQRAQASKLHWDSGWLKFIAENADQFNEDLQSEYSLYQEWFSSEYSYKNFEQNPDDFLFIILEKLL